MNILFTKTSSRAQGFSLVEVLVALTAITISVLASLSLYTITTANTRKSTSLGELNDLVDADIAQARRINENLVCNTGSCSIVSSTTTKDSYFPTVTTSGATSSEIINITFFNNKCISRDPLHGPGLQYGFSEQIRTLSGGLPDGVLASSSRISRRMLQEANGHRYTLIYTETGSGRFLRQVTLVPTTVSWCPNEIP